MLIHEANGSITEPNSYSSFSDILVFVCLCLSNVFVIVIVFPITQCKIEFTYQSQKPPNFKVILEW